jgi:DNA-binding phage protein
LSGKGVQKALSENGNPQFSSVNAIMHAMGSGWLRKNFLLRIMLLNL